MGDDKIVKLKKELAKTKSSAEEYLAGWKRAKADYLNLQKETDKKIGVVSKFVRANILLEILPIYDNLKQAVKHFNVTGQTPPNPPLFKGEKGENWIKGVEQIRKQFEHILKNLGVEEIKTVGEKFNPELHEAVVHEKQKGVEADVIFEEVEAGYRLNGEVLRVARVKVAK